MKVEKNYFTYNYIIKFFYTIDSINILLYRKKENTYKILNKDGYNIENRYNPPEGYSRVEADKDSFAYFLRHEKLKNMVRRVSITMGKRKRVKVFMTQFLI